MITFSIKESEGDEGSSPVGQIYMQIASAKLKETWGIDLSVGMTIMSQLAFSFQISWIQFPFVPLTASMEFAEVNENLNAPKMQENG